MYNVNIKRFSRSLLPISMRGDDSEQAKVYHLMDVLTHPFRVLHNRFMAFRSKSSWNLNYNACVGSMQAMLNERFADVLSIRADGTPILVEDGNQVMPTIVYPNEEQNPLMIGVEMVTSSTVWGVTPFLVKIPSELEGDNDIKYAIVRMVNSHKFAGTQYSIIYY